MNQGIYVAIQKINATYSWGKIMITREEKLVSWLFKTEAVRVCPENKPFWYTSGTIGPYYINTHFLYGSEKKAVELLRIIDFEKDNIFEFPYVLSKLLRYNYENDEIYKGLINEMIAFISEKIGPEEIDYISGGERRDWFFSPIIAELLNKPHIFLYKNNKAYLSDMGEVKEVTDIKDKKVLHIADLITEASSYERNWIPAIEALGGNILWSVVVVDRKQGGGELLKSKNVESYAMVSVDKSLFEQALTSGHINNEQYSMILKFIDNPKESMKNFLKEHPEFLENALNSDAKTAERAKLCIDKNLYDL